MKVALMATLTAAGAFIRIPLPYLPVTLQANFACLAGVWLGPWHGALSQVVYLCSGLIGFPVFAGGGGPQYVLRPTFGYLLGFVGAAAIVGIILRSGHSYLRVLVAFYAGMMAIYVPGVTYYYLNVTYVSSQSIPLAAVLGYNILPLLKDATVSLLAASVGMAVRNRMRRRP